MSFSGEAAELLALSRAAAGRTRAARPSRAVPFLVLGLVVAGAMPLYPWRPFPGLSGRLGAWPGGPFAGFEQTVGGVWTSVYWLLALPAAYAVIAWWYARSARRVGVAVSVRPLVLAGLGLLALLGLVLFVSPLPWPPNLFVRGLAPLLTIAVGLAVWAVAERSGALSVAAAVFLAAALTAMLYDVENVLSRFGLTVGYPHTLQPSMGLCALVLFAEAAVFAVADRRRRRRLT